MTTRYVHDNGHLLTELGSVIRICLTSDHIFGNSRQQTSASRLKTVAEIATKTQFVIVIIITLFVPPSEAETLITLSTRISCESKLKP